MWKYKKWGVVSIFGNGFGGGGWSLSEKWESERENCVMKMKEREKVKGSVDFGWGICTWLAKFADPIIINHQY